MGHLTEEALLDLAEGTRLEEASARHLASCGACRGQLEELRSIMRAAADVQVPEPSPLFWEHLSARVREAVEAAGRPAAAGWRSWPAISWRVTLPVGALGALLLAAATMFRPGVGPSSTVETTAGSRIADVGTSAIRLRPLAEDASLSLLADLTSELDWDAATEAGLASRSGVVDSVVTDLSSEERVELGRLLEDALSPPGA